MSENVRPYKESSESKKVQVAKMFDNIAHKYDFLNHFFSLGIDILWRKKSIRLLKGRPSEMILDVATGTGDMAFELLKLNPKKVVGVDISQGMLDVGIKKIKEKGKESIMEFQLGDSEGRKYMRLRIFTAAGISNKTSLHLLFQVHYARHRQAGF
jgi:demethylmenaquinone methyltransferase / 2-methoxy-6-polyprenyl-1,4-benzoquinol methylase